MKKIVLILSIIITSLSFTKSYEDIIKIHIRSQNKKLNDYQIQYIYNNVIEKSQKYNVDPTLVFAVMDQESDYNHNEISNTGAIGIMQLMPLTAKELGVNPRRVEENIDGGIRYLRQQLDKYNGKYKVHYALASYNAGAGSVKKYGGIPPYTETQNYVRKILENYNKLNQNESREIINISENEDSKLRVIKENKVQEIKTIIFKSDKKLSFYKGEWEYWRWK